MEPAAGADGQRAGADDDGADVYMESSRTSPSSEGSGFSDRESLEGNETAGVRCGGSGGGCGGSAEAVRCVCVSDDSSLCRFVGSVLMLLSGLRFKREEGAGRGEGGGDGGRSGDNGADRSPRI
jgi:hypothetical protein